MVAALGSVLQSSRVVVFFLRSPPMSATIGRLLSAVQQAHGRVFVALSFAARACCGHRHSSIWKLHVVYCRLYPLIRWSTLFIDAGSFSYSASSLLRRKRRTCTRGGRAAKDAPLFFVCLRNSGATDGTCVHRFCFCVTVHFWSHVSCHVRV